MIYFVQDSGNFEIKIGYTAGEIPHTRINDLQTGNPNRLELLLTCEGTRKDEKALHDRFKEARGLGEWFKPTPEILRYIITLAEARGRREQAIMVRELRRNTALKLWCDNIPDGLRRCVLVALIDLGEHLFRGTCRRLVYLVWEIRSDKDESIVSGTVGKVMPLSMEYGSELRKIVEDWKQRELNEGEEVDLTQYIGIPCMMHLSKPNTDDQLSSGIAVGSVIPMVAPVDPVLPVVQYEIESEEPPPSYDWIPPVDGMTVAEFIGRSLERSGEA